MALRPSKCLQYHHQYIYISAIGALDQLGRLSPSVGRVSTQDSEIPTKWICFKSLDIYLPLIPITPIIPIIPLIPIIPIIPIPKPKTLPIIPIKKKHYYPDFPTPNSQIQLTFR